VQRGGAQPVHIIAEIGVGQIAPQDLVLAQPGLQPERDQHLAQLARQAAFGGEEADLGELLRDRAAALHAAAGDVRPERARQPARIDAPVRIEAPVLDREERFDHMRRQPVDRDWLLHHRPAARDRRAIGGEQRDFGRRDRLERFRQGCGDRQPGEQDQEKHEQCGERALRPPPAGARGLDRLGHRWIDLGRIKPGIARLAQPRRRPWRIGSRSPAKPKTPRSESHFPEHGWCII